MFLVLFFNFLKEDFSILSFNLLKENFLNLGAVIFREAEFEIYKPFYFHIRETHFLDKNFSPYSIRFEWNTGLRRIKNNFIFKFLYSHTCNHGIDHEGEDRRQWNHFAIKIEKYLKNFYFKNYTGYVTSPFGPKRKYNDYNFIFFHNFGIIRDLKNLKINFDLELYGFLSKSSLKYSFFLKFLITHKNNIFGTGIRKDYGLKGDNPVWLNKFFKGLFCEFPEIDVSYSLFLKNKNHSFFSRVILKYILFKRKVKIFTSLETVSPYGVQYPRFYDYKAGFEFEFKFLNVILYHRERRDGNLFDGKKEELNSLSLKRKLEFGKFNFVPKIEYYLKTRNYSFYFLSGFQVRLPVYKYIGYEADFYILKGNKDFGVIIEKEVYFFVKLKRELKFSLIKKVASEKTLESYGLFQYRLAISLSNLTE